MRKGLSLQQYLPFTVLKQINDVLINVSLILLQQYLPFTVLKQAESVVGTATANIKLQQYLPFTVLKLIFSRM